MIETVSWIAGILVAAMSVVSTAWVSVLAKRSNRAETRKPEGSRTAAKSVGFVGVTYAECRAAARSVRRAELAQEAIATARPRGPFGVLRSNAPLAILLYVAAYDGCLVWRSPNSFVLLHPPGRILKSYRGGFRLAVLRRIAWAWDSVLFSGPPATLLIGAGLATLVFTWTDWRFILSAGLVLVLAALVYTTALMICLAITGLIWFIRAFGKGQSTIDREPAQLVPRDRWTMTLCHHVDGADPEVLLQQVSRHLTSLVRAGLDESRSNLPVTRVSVMLVWLQRGTSTIAMREAVSRWNALSRPTDSGDVVSIRMSSYQRHLESNRQLDRGGFLFWYLAGVAAVIAVLARFVAEWERAACSGGCAGRPATYESALRWLLHRLLFTDPIDIAPATIQVQIVGWLASLLALVTVGVVFIAARRYLRFRAAELRVLQGPNVAFSATTRTVIVVATSAERQAVIEAIRGTNGVEPAPLVISNHQVLQLGTISRTSIVVVQTPPASASGGPSAIFAATLVHKLMPDFLIVLGTCYGLRPSAQSLGDVIVCNQLRALGPLQVDEPSDVQSADLDRAELLPSESLLKRLQVVADVWKGDVRVHFGSMLSLNAAVTHDTLRESLRAQHSDALGAEMESAGVYAAVASRDLKWIVVKAINDWGIDQVIGRNDFMPHSGVNFVVAAAKIGAFDDVAATESSD